MKKFRASFLAAIFLTASVFVPVIEPSVEAASVKSFSDVSKSSTYYDIIHQMAEKGIIKGYDDGTFKPDQELSRKHAAELVQRLGRLEKRSVTKIAPKDLTTKHPNYEALMLLYNRGLLELDSKGNINPNAALSRGEMAKILAITFELILIERETPLKDVSKENELYISALYDYNITTGFEDNTFRENESLTRAHYAIFMYRAIDAKKEADELANTPEQLAIQKAIDSSALGETRKNQGTELPKSKQTLTKKELTQQLNAEFMKIKAEKGLGSNGGFNPQSMSRERLRKAVEIISTVYNITPETLTQQFTKAYEEGIVVTNDGVSDVPYAFYFDYVNGEVIRAVRR